MGGGKKSWDYHLVFNPYSNVNYPQDRHEFIHEIFGIKPRRGDTQVTQNLGGWCFNSGTRLLVFPNILQHCVSPFSLANKSQPDHR